MNALTEMFIIKADRGDDGVFRYDVPQYTKLVLKKMLTVDHDRDSEYVSSIYQALSKLNLLGTDPSVRPIVSDNGGALVSVLNQLRYRLGRDSRDDIRDKYRTAIVGKCKLRIIRGDFTAAYFLKVYRDMVLRRKGDGAIFDRIGLGKPIGTQFGDDS